jgi:hypothetical protein
MEREGKERTCAREEKKGTTTPTPNSMYVYVFVNLLFVIDKKTKRKKKSFFFLCCFIRFIVTCKKAYIGKITYISCSTLSIFCCYIEMSTMLTIQY